jgi:hypothetical protein
MGLDLVVEASAKNGHEVEWRRLVERAFADDPLTDAEVARFNEISIPSYMRVGAPRVGSDSAADAWIVEARKATTPEEVATVLRDFDGYFVLDLVRSDGVPAYSHGDLYDGVDKTSFRGAFLSACEDVLSKELIEQAWAHMMPEAALDYGRALLAAAQAAPTVGPRAKEPPPKPGLLSRLGLAKKTPEPEPFEEQIRIVEAAGRWFVFWGERGHPIRAFY